MTTEELTAMKDRIAKAEQAAASVERAKGALAEAEKLTPALVAQFGAGRDVAFLALLYPVAGPGTSLIFQAAEKHAPAYIEAIKGQLKAHLKVQEERLANA